MSKIITISLIFFLSVFLNYIDCETPVTGRCGRPAMPAKANKHLISPQQSRFDNKEKVDILCKDDEFPLPKHRVECMNSKWIGKPARCGRHMDAQVIHLDIYECQTQNHELLVRQPLNQTDEPQPGYGHLRPNSYHTLRVREGMKTSANGSNCYTFEIRFNTKVQIWFLLTEIWTISTEKNITLNVSPFVSKYRTCILHEEKRVENGGTIFSNTFICDLKTDSDYKKEQFDASEVITLSMNTNFEDEIGLDGIFIGDVFTKTSGTKNVRPDCGDIEISNIGVDLQKEGALRYIMCNESFVDKRGQNIKEFGANGNPIHKFTCNWNGLWVGDWPVCHPIKTCPQDNLEKEKDSTVIIEEIGNVFFMNESNWFAINNSFIRYRCVDESDIMTGNKFSTCMKSGHWSSKAPSCTRAGISVLGIAGILFAILIVFVLIVLVVFRMHSKNVKRELKETRNVVEESARKRYTEEFYADVKQTDFYDDPDVRPKTMDYGSTEYETVDAPRYGADPNRNRPPSPEYLDMVPNK